MGNFLLLILCLSAGMVLRRLGRLPANAPASLNVIVLQVALPALAIVSLRKLTLGPEILYPTSMAWILYVVAAILMVGLGRLLGWDRKTVGAMILTSGLGNTSFVGYPILEALYGPSALKTAVLTDQLGSFLVLSTLGILTAGAFSGKKIPPRAIVKRLVTFPPFLAVVFALATKSWIFPAAVTVALERIGGVMVPLALVSVGFQLEWQAAHLQEFLKPLSLGLAYKLLLAPGLIALLFVGIAGQRGEAIQITILEASMAPMVTGAIIATEYGLNSAVANLMVTIGIPLSLFTTLIWYWAIK